MRSWAPAGPILQILMQARIRCLSSIPSPSHVQQCGQIRETLVNLPPPHPSFLDLQLDVRIVTLHATRPMGHRTSLFTANWAKSLQDQWILSTIQRYHLPLVHWPHRWLSKGRLEDIKHSTLQGEVHKLVQKGAMVQVQPSQVHISSPMFVVPKSGRSWRPIIDLRFLNTFLEPPTLQDRGALHVTS